MRALFILCLLLASCGNIAAHTASAVPTYSHHYIGIPLRTGGPHDYRQNDIGPPTILLGAGGWATYSWQLTGTARNGIVRIMPEQGSGGEYWVGLADKARARWVWYGPFSGAEQPGFGDPNALECQYPYDFDANGNSVTVYCTAPMAMRFVDYGLGGE